MNYSTELPNSFCDYLTVSQYHSIPHTPFHDGYKSKLGMDEKEINRTLLSKTIELGNGSSIQVRSDGNTVTVSGNLSKITRSESIQGLDLDQLKLLINELLPTLQLPVFTSGETILTGVHTDNKTSQQYTGAKFSRIDMTLNVDTKSPANKRLALQHIQSLHLGKLDRDPKGLNTYFGLYSKSKTILVYDKALQLKEQILKKSTEPDYIQDCIELLSANGSIRIEAKYKGFLRDNANLNYWHNATQSNLNTQFLKDINPMLNDIEATDLDEIPTKFLGTLAMYFMGVNVKERLNKNTFYSHKKVLKEYGYDISNQNISALKPKQKTIVLSVTEMPSWYKHAITAEDFKKTFIKEVK